VDKVLAHDLRLDSDQLEQAADLLAAEERKLQAEIGQLASPAQKEALLRRLALLERILEKVNEACVMF